MPPATGTYVEGIMFWGCPFVNASVCACIQVLVLLAWYPTNRWTEFHQTLVDDVVVEGRDDLLEFWMLKVKVKVTARSYIWVSYCCRQRHIWGIKLSSGLFLKMASPYFHIFTGRQRSCKPCTSYDRHVRPSVRLSVCPSHAGTEWKRRKLGSRNLHRRIAQGL